MANVLNVSHIHSMQDLALTFILLALAVYRLTVMIVDEEGPFELFFRLRMRAGAYDYNDVGEIKTELGKLFRCPYCMGVWISLVALCVLLFLPFGLAWAPVVWLALSGAQYLAQARTDYLKPTSR